MSSNRLFQRVIALALLCCLLMGIVPVASAATKKKTDILVSFSVSQYQNRARDVLKQINELREIYDLPKLIMTADMEKAAIQRAAETFVFFDHKRPNMTEFDTIFTEFESLAACEVSAELFATGFSKADEVMLDWEDQYKDLLVDGDFTHAGLACVYLKDSYNEYYWVLILAGFPEDYDEKAAGAAVKAGTNKTMKVIIDRDMYVAADNSHKNFELRVSDINMKSKQTANVTVNLYDRYDVKIGKVDPDGLTFKSSNTSLFTVSAEGQVKRKKSGTGTLTVTAPGLESVKCEVVCGSGTSSNSSGSSGSSGSNSTAVTATTIKDRVPDLTATEYSKYVKLSVYVKGASGYVLYRSTSKTGTYTKVDEQATTKRWDVKLQNEDITRTYYYKVRAYKNSNGKRVYSEYSDPVKVTAP